MGGRNWTTAQIGSRVARAVLGGQFWSPSFSANHRSVWLTFPSTPTLESFPLCLSLGPEQDDKNLVLSLPRTRDEEDKMGRPRCLPFCLPPGDNVAQGLLPKADWTMD